MTVFGLFTRYNRVIEGATHIMRPTLECYRLTQREYVIINEVSTTILLTINNIYKKVVLKVGKSGGKSVLLEILRRYDEIYRYNRCQARCQRARVFAV